jgi:hypothetical protein
MVDDMVKITYGWRSGRNGVMEGLRWTELVQHFSLPPLTFYSTSTDG